VLHGSSRFNVACFHALLPHRPLQEGILYVARCTLLSTHCKHAMCPSYATNFGCFLLRLSIPHKYAHAPLKWTHEMHTVIYRLFNRLSAQRLSPPQSPLQSDSCEQEWR
jgi:hypothetical protein